VSGPGGVSGVLQVTLRADGSFAGGALRPIRLVRPGIPAPDPTAAADRLVRGLSREDFGRRALRLSPLGDLTPPR
jgi:hypothetical protein